MTDHTPTDEELLEALRNSPDFEEWAPSGAAPSEADEDLDINLDDALPEPEHAPAPDGNTATEAQLNFLKKLVQERAGDDKAQKLAQEARAQYARSEFSKASASHLIEALMDIPSDWKRERDSRPDAPEGIHKLGDTIYKVQIAVRGSGRPYAKRLDVTPQCPGHLDEGPSAFDAPLVYCADANECPNRQAEAEFVYEAGAVRKLSEDTLLPLEEAQKFGRLYGVCCACGRVLTDENSIAAGIGPICADKF